MQSSQNNDIQYFGQNHVKLASWKSHLNKERGDFYKQFHTDVTNKYLRKKSFFARFLAQSTGEKK